MTNHERKMEIVVEPGMSPGENLIYPNECSDTAEFTEAGDLHIILTEADETGRVQRSIGGKYDLHVETTIRLTDSLLGCTEKIDGHPGYPQGLVVEIPAGIQNMCVITVNGGGLPIRNVPGSVAAGKGNLYLRVYVKVSDTEKGVLQQYAEQLRELFNPVQVT